MIFLGFAACHGIPGAAGKTAAGKDAAATDGGQDSKSTADANAKPADANATSADPSAMLDTAALQKDMNTVLNGIATGHPDTAALKKAGADFISTSQKMLSDSGIDALYGNSSDPAVRSAAETLKKLRNATGLTPDKLDSLKKAADLLKAN